MRSVNVRAVVLGVTAALVAAQAAGAVAYFTRFASAGRLDAHYGGVTHTEVIALAVIVAGALCWLAAQLVRTAVLTQRDGRALGGLATVVAVPILVVNVVVALVMIPQLHLGPAAAGVVALAAATAAGLGWAARDAGARRTA